MSCNINRLGFIQQKDSQLWHSFLERLDVMCEVNFSGANVDMTGATVDFTGATVVGLPGALTGDKQSVALVGDRSITTATPTTLTTWTDTGTGLVSNANFVLATGVYTAPRTGSYLVTGSVSWKENPASNSGTRVTRIIVNGGTTVKELITQPTPNIAINTPQAFSLGLSLTLGDTVELEVEQTSGLAAFVEGTPQLGTLLSICEIM